MAHEQRRMLGKPPKKPEKHGSKPHGSRTKSAQKRPSRSSGQPFEMDIELTPIFYHGGGCGAMTNEELVALIQAGERDRIPELWAQVERFVRWKARKMGEISQRRGVTLDDLMQAGFIAVMAAVDYFDPDSGYTFTTYLGNTLKKEFADATGYRTKRAREDPFWDAVPLDTHVNDDDPEGATISDFIVDFEVEQAFPDSEQGQLREALEAEITRLTEEQQVVIQLRYWYGFELGQIAHIMGKSLKEVDKLDKMAMRELRRNHKALKPFFASEGEYLMKREQAFLKRIEQLRQPSRYV